MRVVLRNMKHRFTHIGRLFYLDADIPADVSDVTMKSGGITVKAKKLFWRFFWIV